MELNKICEETLKIIEAVISNSEINSIDKIDIVYSLIQVIIIFKKLKNVSDIKNS